MGKKVLGGAFAAIASSDSDAGDESQSEQGSREEPRKQREDEAKDDTESEVDEESDEEQDQDVADAAAAEAAFFAGIFEPAGRVTVGIWPEGKILEETDRYSPIRDFDDLLLRGVAADLVAACRRCAVTGARVNNTVDPGSGGAGLAGGGCDMSLRPTAVQAELWGYLLMASPPIRDGEATFASPKAPDIMVQQGAVASTNPPPTLAASEVPKQYEALEIPPLEAHEIPIPDTDSDLELAVEPPSDFADSSSFRQRDAQPVALSGSSVEVECRPLSSTCRIRETLDIIGIAPTGSGKTLAYVLPLLADGLCAVQLSASSRCRFVFERFASLFPLSFGLTKGQAILERCKRLRDTGDDRSLLSCIIQVAQKAEGGNNVALVARWRSLRQECDALSLVAPRGVVLAPTRELALQVSQVARLVGASCEGVVGGVDHVAQRQNLLCMAPALVVATPGRLRALCGQVPSSVRQRLPPCEEPPPPEVCVTLTSCVRLILDEGDRLLDEGFDDDIQALIGLAAKRRQSFLFSATWSAETQSLTKLLRASALHITVSGVAATIKQDVELVPRSARAKRLRDILRMVQGRATKILVFVLYKKEAKDLATMLAADGWNAWALQGDMSQAARNKSLQSFRDASQAVLVATDVAARGLDIQGVSHVINFSLGLSVDSYVHRIGRCGRAGRQGHAFTFVTDGDERHAGTLVRILQESGQPVPPGLKEMAASFANSNNPLALKWSSSAGEVKLVEKNARACGKFGVRGAGSDEEDIRGLRHSNKANHSKAGAPKGGRKGKGKGRGR